MNGRDALLERVRMADPVDPAELQEWTSSGDARRVLERVTHAGNRAETAARRRRPGRRAASVAVVVTVGLTSAAAAAGLLGGSAPDRVREHLADLDRGMPDDLRLNPDVEHARAVAATSSGALYAADLKDGGYCLEVVTDGDRPRGAVCVTAAHLGDRPFEVTAPIPSGPRDALLVGGRINDGRVTQIVTRYSSGASAPVELGLDRSWLLEVPAGEREAALRNGLVVAGIGADGSDVSTVAVPPLRDDDPQGTRRDHLQPIFVSTISTEDDLTLVLGIEGSVNVDGASTLELQYPDGTTTAVPLERDGSYRFTLPTDRQADFASASGRLIARDAAAQIVATAPVSSVAGTRRAG